MSSSFNSTNKRVGNSKSMYPINVIKDDDDDDDDDATLNQEINPAENIKHNFNTLLIYIIKLLMKNTKNPYDGFKVDNYVLFENSQSGQQQNKTLSYIPALHKPGLSIKTDNFDDIENLLKAQMAIHKGSSIAPGDIREPRPWNQTNFSIINRNLHKGWSRENDGKILQTLIDNLIYTNPSQQRGGKKKINGGSNSQSIFKKIKEAQISDIQPFRKYASSIGKDNDYQYMEKEIIKTISNFESQYEKNSNYNKKVQIMAELSNSLYQQKIQTFQMFSKYATEQISYLKNKTQEFEEAKKTHQLKIKSMEKKYSATKEDHSNTRELITTLHTLEKTLEERDTHISLLKTIKKSMEFSRIRRETENKELLRKLNQEEDITRNLGRNLDTQLYNNNIITEKLDLEQSKNARLYQELETLRTNYASKRDELQRMHENKIGQLQSDFETQHKESLNRLQELLRVSEGQTDQISKLQEQMRYETQQHEEKISTLQGVHQDKVRRLETARQEEVNALKANASRMEEAANEAATLAEQEIQKLRETHQDELRKLTEDSKESEKRTAKTNAEMQQKKIKDLQETHESQIHEIESRAAATATNVEATTEQHKQMMQRQIQDLEDKLSANTKDILEKNQRIQVLIRENETILKTKQGADDKIESIEASLRQNQEKIDELEQVNLQLKITNELLERKQSDEAIQQKEQLEQDRKRILNENSSSIANLQDQVNILSQSLQDKLHRCEEQLKIIEKDIAQQQETITSLEQEKNACEQEVERMVLENRELQLKIKEITTSSSESSKETEALKKTIEQLQSSNVNLTQEKKEAESNNIERIERISAGNREELEQTKKALQDQIKNTNRINQEKITSLENEHAVAIENKGSIIAKNKAEMAELRGIYSGMEALSKKQINESQKKNQECEKKLQEKTTVVGDLIQQIDKLQDDVKLSEGKFKEYQEKNDNCEEKRGVLVEEISALQEDAKIKESAIGETNAELARKSKQVNTLEEQIGSERRTSHDTKEQLNAANEKISKLENDKRLFDISSAAAASKEIENKKSIDTLKNELSELQLHASRLTASSLAASSLDETNPSKNERKVYDNYKKYITRERLPLVSPYGESDNQESKLEKLKNYIHSEIASYFLKHNIDILDRITRDPNAKLEQAVALDIVLYILKSITGENIIHKIKPGMESQQYATDSRNFILNLMKKDRKGKRQVATVDEPPPPPPSPRRESFYPYPPRPNPEENILDNVANYFYHMILFDKPLSSIRKREAVNPKESRYIKTYIAKIETNVAIGSGRMWGNIKKSVLRDDRKAFGPNIKIIEIVKSIISSIVPHIRGMVYYFKERMFSSQSGYRDTSPGDRFLSRANIDHANIDQDSLRLFLSELENIDARTIETFSIDITQAAGKPKGYREPSPIKKIHSIIANAADIGAGGGSSSKLVYSLKKGKSNKGNKTKRHKGNISK